MEVSSITEQLLFTTVRIETINLEGEKGIGTGFVFNYSLGDKSYLFLITNKHVISGTKEGLLTFIKSDGQNPILGEGHRLKIDNFQRMWFGHSKGNVDVAIAPFVPILNHISTQSMQIFFKYITKDIIPTNEDLKKIDAIEEILFIGYPTGIWDSKNLIPVARRGITATPVYLDFQGEKQFLIDASVFPGSSGSPVFIYNPGIYWDKHSGATVVGHRLFFLGILSAVFQMPDTGEIVISPGVSETGQIIIPTRRPAVSIKQLIDLGIVFKAETILETIEEFLKTGKNV